MKETDCKTCMYSTRFSGTRKVGQNVFVTSGNSTTCTKEKVNSITVDKNGWHCSDYEPMIEGNVSKEGDSE